MTEARMTTKELRKVEILIEIREGKLTMGEGADLLQITKRHMRRLNKRFREVGAIGIAHQSRGEPSRNRLEETKRKQIIKYLHERYYDFGPTFAAEKLEEEQGIKISKEKVRQLQIEEGLWKAKKQKERKYHPRRARRERRGELIQIDGSEHDWLEGRGERMSLIGFIDDATSEIKRAQFYPSETTEGYMREMKEYIEENGVPEGLYSDRHSIFRQNQNEGYLKGDLTQFGRALKLLGVKLICANSPQAKGRIERSFQTHQDRLVKEMRLEGIRTLEEANKYLEKYIEKHNRKFAVEPKRKEDAHRKKREEENLDRIFSVREKRTLSKGLSFQYKNTLYQIKAPKKVNRLQGEKIEVLKSLEGKMIVETINGETLQVTPYKEYVEETKTVDAKEIGATWAKKGRQKPRKYHPWR